MFKEPDAVEDPCGHFRLLQTIEAVAAVAAFDDNPVEAQHGEVLLRARVGHAEEFLQRVDVALAAAEFLDDADPVRVGQHAEQSGKFFRDDVARRRPRSGRSRLARGC